MSQKSSYVEVKSGTPLIINELLTSLWHALKKNHVPADIAMTISSHYSEADLRRAHAEIDKVCKDTNITFVDNCNRLRWNTDNLRQVRVLEMIKVLQQVDLMGSEAPFVSRTPLCEVVVDPGSQIRLRQEMKMLKAKFEDLHRSISEEMCGFSTKLQQYMNNREYAKTQALTYKEAMTKNPSVENEPTFESTPIKSSIADKALVVIQNVDFDSQTVESKENENIGEDGFVPYEDRRKKLKIRRKSTKKTVGNADNELGAVDQREVKLFVTNLRLGSGPAKLKAYVQDVCKWNVTDISTNLSKSRYYESYKISIRRNRMVIGDILHPEKWPKDVYVRLFYEPRDSNKNNSVARSNSKDADAISQVLSKSTGKAAGASHSQSS